MEGFFNLKSTNFLGGANAHFLMGVVAAGVIFYKLYSK